MYDHHLRSESDYKPSPANQQREHADALAIDKGTVRKRAGERLFTWSFAAILAVAFWWPLPAGYGFIGGDIYNYYFPLKQFYADGLKTRELRFWHPGIGNGAPVLAESQTGIFYPFNLVAYRLFNLNTAYNVVFLLHYGLAFAFAFELARHLELSRIASLLTAMIFVYGWFPPRANLEWSIITGAWTPLSVLATIRWLESGNRLWAWTLSSVTCVQLLAGHFQLAFVTLLAVGLITVSWSTVTVSFFASARRRVTVALLAAAGFGLAAPQIVPTAELMTRSQRAREEFRDSVSFGRIPLGYLAQCIAPYWVYPDAEEWLRISGGNTNKTEAHLYFGIVSLILVPCSLAAWPRRRLVPWLVVIGAGLLLATGIGVSELSGLPGFGYFRYPGRYGLLAQLGVAILAGAGADLVVDRWPSMRRLVLMTLVCLTLVDLFWVGRHPAVQYVTMVKPPVIDGVAKSEVFRRLKPTDRVLALDGNTLALSGAACVPHYLGLGPAEYYPLWDSLPDVFHGELDASRDGPHVLRLLTLTGVTHLLTERPLPNALPVTLVWSGYDPFLHRRWGRFADEPLHLYKFDRSPGRAYFRSLETGELSEVQIMLQPHRVELTVDAPQAGQIVLTDLLYPGWLAELDGQPVAHESTDALPLRVVNVNAGHHKVVWRFVPTSFYLGCAIAATTLLCMLFVARATRIKARPS